MFAEDNMGKLYFQPLMIFFVDADMRNSAWMIWLTNKTSLDIRTID